jgi:polyhydroxybutyrate depolymerase
MKLLHFCLFLFPLWVNAQSISDALFIDSHYRTFSYFPPQQDIKGGSLLFLMHGSGGSSEHMIRDAATLEALAVNDKLLVVYPNGYKKLWNECRKFSTAAANVENIDENAFFSAMIRFFKNKYGISEDKVFAAGFSGGGHMAYKLGLTMPNQIKAIAAIAANMPDSASNDCRFVGKPIPVLIINGTEDMTNPYNGGQMYVNHDYFGAVMSSENTFSYWARLAGYDEAPVENALPDVDPNDHQTIVSYSFRSPNKVPVTLLKVVGGHHDYPSDIDLYVYAWQFFKSLPQLQK